MIILSCVFLTITRWIACADKVSLVGTMGAKQAVIHFPFSHLGDLKRCWCDHSHLELNSLTTIQMIVDQQRMSRMLIFPRLNIPVTTFTWFIHLSMESNRCLQVAQVTLLVTPQFLVITLLQHCLPISNSEPGKNSFFFSFFIVQKQYHTVELR